MTSAAAAAAVLVVTLSAVAWADRRPTPVPPAQTSPRPRPPRHRPGPACLRPVPPRTRDAGPATVAACTSADLALDFPVVQPPQGGGSALIAGLTVYDRSPRPCRLTGTVRLTALDAVGQPIPLQGTATTGPVELTLTASTPDDPVGLQVSLRAATTDPSTGATCPTADRVTAAQLRLTTGPTAQVLVTTANEPAHSAPLWGCRGAIALLAAS